MGPRDLQAAFFASATGAPPYLARWHLAFAPRPGGPGPCVTLWFDRDPEPPLRERIQLPPHPDAHVLRLAALYLAALVNNKLCVWGARRVSLVADDAALGRELLHRVRQLLLHRAEVFSDLTLLFIFALVEQCYGRPLVLDSDADQAGRLAERLETGASGPAPVASAIRPATVAALNIGQHKSACALVAFDEAGGHGVSRLWRRETWPADRPRGLPDLAGDLLADLAGRLGALPPETEAVCLGLANPVLGGLARGVAGVGLCAASDPAGAADLDARLRRAVAEAFPGLPLLLINDAAAQGLFTARYGLGERAAPGPSGAGLLSVRFGACPSVAYVDASGRSLDRFNEYPWLVTTIQANRPGEALLATISRYLSFYGPGSIAAELGLLGKYGLDQGAAAAFFHDGYLRGDEAQWRDAVKVYRVLGAHLAMLAYEIERDTPVGQVQLLGSAANHLDAAVFDAVWDGFAGFVDRHALPFASIGFGLTEAASDKAGLVGAALAHAAGPADASGSRS